MTETDHGKFQGHSWEHLDQGPGGGQAPGCPYSDPAGSPGRPLLPACPPPAFPGQGQGQGQRQGPSGSPFPQPTPVGGLSEDTGRARGELQASP